MSKVLVFYDSWKQFGLYCLGGLIIGAGFIGYKEIFGSSENVVNLNVLEKATIVGNSNRNDFDVFRREGGLEITNLWNQFYVETVETTYGDNDILESVTLKLEKKGYAGLYGSIDASYTNITEKLAATCGTEWKKQHEIEQVYESKNAGYYCKYEYPSSSSSVFVTISKSEQ